MEKLDTTNIPQHIAIIMDGNGRWAAERGKPRSFGHQAGVDAVRRITSECTRLGVKYLTLYTFSTENWNRPATEVAALMGLVLTSLEDEIFMKNNVRFQVIGDIERLPKEVQQKLQETMDHTAHNSAMTMVVALSYSSRWEIVKATREIAADLAAGKIQDADINEQLISEHMTTSFMPDPDLLIRTGGEQRKRSGGQTAQEGIFRDLRHLLARLRRRRSAPSHRRLPATPATLRKDRGASGG